MAKAFSLLIFESWPRLGPMVRTSMTFSLTGNAPERSRMARFFASSSVRLPVMTALPPVIGSLTTGAVNTSPSSKMAILWPTLAAVKSANLSAPSSVNSMATTFWLPFSICSFAVFKSLPVRRVAPLSSLNSMTAVLPIVSMAFSGFFSPGSSTMMRRAPSFCTSGSVRPISLIRRSTIETARFSESSVTGASGVSSASRTICVPPCKSRPCLIELASG